MKKRGGGEKSWNGGGTGVLEEGTNGGCCQCGEKPGGSESFMLASLLLRCQVESRWRDGRWNTTCSCVRVEKTEGKGRA